MRTKAVYSGLDEALIIQSIWESLLHDMPLYDICLFSNSDSDCCSVHNFSVTPSIFLSPAVLSPLTVFPIGISLCWGMLCGERGREAGTTPMG